MADNEVDSRARLEARRRSLLRDVERALLGALSESADMHRAILRLQREGLTLQVSLDCSGDAAAPAGLPGRPASGPRSEPAFRIDAEDLRFLRSIGIDPTRRRPGRRPR